MCGEKHRSVGLPKSRVGSPPRMRGKRSAKPLHSYNSWDHPRVCGEKGDGSSAAAAEPGSPPRMRGKDKVLKVVPQDPGITPAYAGKRNWQCSTMKMEKDHPRVCGEKYQWKAGADTAIGSPPRMRGKVMYGIHDKSVPRITPAYAGKREAYGTNTSRSRDHPRVCGEKFH